MSSNDTVPEMQAVRDDDLVSDRVPCLLLLNGVDAGRLIPLDFSGGALTVGRLPTCAIHLPNAEVSRSHAELRLLHDGAIELVDLQSRNGSFVNNSRVECSRVVEGDRLRFGPRAMLKLVLRGADEQAIANSLHARAGRDSLTAVMTRRYFMDAFQREWSFARRHQVPLSLIMIDLDHFKWLNDDYGHITGDAVLVEFANRVRQLVRNEDLFGRYGGEEFVLMLRNTLLDGALIVAERCRRAIADQPFAIADQRIAVTASFGVACFEHQQIAESTPEAMFAVADRHLYLAKEGRNRVWSSDLNG